MTNHLVQSTSPYLLQHAQNPVDWFPWGPDALEKARAEDKPIFLSIGYAACHWCHVMAHESFEDILTAAVLNEHFVSIKVDREERPDLDSIYMAAVVAITGQGGWPMSVFLTPDLQPFYAGTYFPSTARHGLPAFRDLLRAVSDAWQNRRSETLRAGEQVTAQITAKTQSIPLTGSFTHDTLDTAGANLIRTCDDKHGGWGVAPKFPQPMALEFLLRRHLAGDPDALPSALQTLHAMVRGGMYDLVDGGFARYATDREWRVPHFEKMLYDNALLVPVYLHTWQVTRDPFFRRVGEDTLAFIIRELTSPEGGFFASLDADSEGAEGIFYAWTREEIRTALGGANDLFEAAHAVTLEGNWEGKILLRRELDDQTLAVHFDMPPEQVEETLKSCYAALLAARESRPRPATDDKVLCAWNGLALAAFAEAGRILDDGSYLGIAQKNAAFLLEALRPDGHLRRVWRNGQVGREVFLDDFAALILGLLELYQADFDSRWYIEAVRLAEEMISRFSDPAGGFFDTPVDAPTLLTRPKDIQDNAIPSGNALAAEALFKLSAFSKNGSWEELAQKALALVSDPAARFPTGFGRWLGVADFSLHPGCQVALLGELNDPRMAAFLAELRLSYDPYRSVAASPYPPPEGSPGLLADRPLLNGAPTAYVCKGFFCKRPVTNFEDFRQALAD